jgi:23S rRNA pseudouridine2605 synthase
VKERLQKILARAGISSRRKAEEIILEGRVCVNGAVVLELGFKADAGHDVIELDGMAIGAAENKVYLMLNKPPGFITSVEDPQGRPTVMSLVSGIPERVVPVGRLDYETEGLLVMTNDGDFSQMLQHPRFEVERCYRVKIKGVPSRIVLDKLRAGVFIDNVKTNRCRIKILSKLDKNSWLEVRLKEGRNRQIRKMFEAVGHEAIRIIRTEFGPLELGALPVGAYRFLNKIEIEAIRTFEKKQPKTPAKKTAPKFVRKNYRSKVT